MSLSFDSISAVLPVKNGENYLPMLIPRILNMLRSDDTLIVVNDGSADATKQITQEFCSTDSRLILINTPGVGLIESLNLAIQVSKNPWVARFDVDDEYSEQRIQEQRKLIDSGVSVIFSDYKFMSSSGVEMGSVQSAVDPLATLMSLISSQRTPHPVALIRREDLIKAGGYHIDDFPVEDLAVWFRISTFGSIISSPICLLSYRLSGGSISAKNRALQKVKRKEIISNYPAWTTLRDANLENFQRLLHLYDSLPDRNSRLFLHLRDYHLLRKITGTKTSIWKLLASIGVVRSLKVFCAGLVIAFMGTTRRFYRLLKKFNL